MGPCIGGCGQSKWVWLADLPLMGESHPQVEDKAVYATRVREQLSLAPIKREFSPQSPVEVSRKAT